MWALRIRLQVQRKKLYDLRCAISHYEDRRTPKMIKMQRIIGEIEATLYRCESLVR
jgi:hypothetical protein